jgi:uridine kinase
MATVDELVAIAGAHARGLIAIDGLPASGKTTLTSRLSMQYKLDSICLDDFLLPQAEWPSQTQPAFPFEFARYGEFMNAVRTLATTGECTYLPFDWAALRISQKPRTVRADRPVVIEGVSALHPDLCGLYALRIFVDSDRATTHQAAKVRGLGLWIEPWERLFLPSSDIYMKSGPQERADIIVPGRGIEHWTPAAKSKYASR